MTLLITRGLGFIGSAVVRRVSSCTDEVVVTTMSVTRPWGRLSSHDLDFASADSAMGHAADLALGIALARPDRTVVCLNGDGSMLMSLGTKAPSSLAQAGHWGIEGIRDRGM